jgi:uncharacterized protein YbaP (TraB family)
MLSKPSLCLSCLAAGLLASTASAGVYKCLDSNNRVLYQDKPCQDSTSADLSPELANLAPKDTRPLLLWKLSGRDKTLYILGSLPFGTPDMFPLPKPVMDAFKSSTGLILANAPDLGDAVPKSPEAARLGYYADGSVLSSHVKPETWQRTQELAKSLRIPEDKIAAQKPWLAALTLKNAALRQAGFDDKMAVGKSFLKAAESSKPVVEIDSVETQVDRYEKLTNAEQEQLLQEALFEADSENGYFKGLADAFLNGDESGVAVTEQKALQSIAKPERSMAERTDRLNQALAEKIFEMTADGRTQFVVVDARYLVGGSGILAKLEEKGFSSSKF